ncbi:hypothetical protein DCAR_0311687 [Daucus carota subsp. sativus]|uniref:Aquaporin n=1 Tax=Daucus carota subsp. sativus TaxID=79200 RepID=A0AAF0WN66_DAUCS|nr:hypothetical protein DCAR_0311687 [Daucus carota subsp. sativus]
MFVILTDCYSSYKLNLLRHPFYPPPLAWLWTHFLLRSLAHLRRLLHSGFSTGASMNPVRTLGPSIATNNYKAIWIYSTAPILDALAGAGTYSLVKLPEEDLKNTPPTL